MSTRYDQQSSPPSLSAVRQVMDELCTMWDSVAPGTTTYRGDLDAIRAVGIRAHAHHAVRVARVLLNLDLERSGVELVPLVRLVMECGVTAAWLLLTPESSAALMRDGATQRRKALQQILLLGDDPGPALAQAEETLTQIRNSPNTGSFAFEQRCLRLDGGDRLYLTYRVFSALSHSGLGVADIYVVEQESSPIGLAFNPHPSNDIREATIGTAACMLLLALNAHDIARATPTEREEIARAASVLGVGVRIVASDGTEATPNPEPPSGVV